MGTATIMRIGGVDVNKIIRYAKKAFKFYQKWQKKQDQKKQQQHAQAAQQQSHAGTPYPQQQSYPQQQQQPWGQQGPYPQQQPSTQYPQSSGPYGGYQASAPSTGISSHQEYEAMRNEANRHGDMMSQCFSQSQQAYDADDHGRAKELSNEGKHHQQQMEELNERCSAWIYHENNKSQPHGSVDLHGLYVQEAIEYTEKAIKSAKSEGLTELRLIVGKGNHSENHVRKIAPAVNKLMKQEHLTAAPEPGNYGVIVVHLAGQGGGRDGDSFSREMEQRGGSGDSDCIIM